MVLFRTLALQPTNQTAFTSWLITKKARLWRLVGTNPTAESGAKKMTCCLPYIPQPRGAAAGFATTRAWGSSGSCGKNYPELWALMLKWDSDSPVTFKADGHTVHDFDRRFRLEDEGLIYPDDKVFRWDMLDKELNYRWF